MSNNNAEGEEEEGRRRNNDADEREDNNANEGDNPVNEMEQLLANLQLFVGVYAFDDIEVHRRHRTSITNEQIYPYLENRGGEGGGRPNTASQPISPAVFDLFEERKVDESVRKRGYSNHEEGYEVLIEEATDAVGNNYESLTGSEAASLLYMFDADNSSGIKPASKRQRIVQRSMREEKPSSNLFQQLIPSTEPPTPDDPDFDDFVKETILDKWGIWDYIKDDDRVNYLYQSNQGSFEGDNADLHLRYAILTTDTSILPDSQRNNISIVVKDIGNYTVFEILSIWFASDNCIRKYCKGSEVRNIWLKNHPYPIGRQGIDDISDSKTKIKKFYKHANVILALYIYQVITAFKEGRLRAFKAAVGLQVHGPHWIILNNTMNGTIDQASVSGVGRVVQVIRLAGFAHAVVVGYHHKISDDDADYTIDGVTYKLGYEFMSGSRAHTNHRQCFTNEEVAPGIYADRCLSLRNHLACCDAKVNLSNNEKCLGSSVACISAHPTYARTLHSLCTCHTAEGNFSGARCTFVHFRNVFSDASQIEKISPHPNGGGAIYRYIPDKLPSHDSDSQPPTEKLPTLDMVQQQISSLKIKSSSDDDALFNHNPVPTTFPQAERDSENYYVLLDFETTGLNAKTSYIIDLAVSSLESANIHTDYINPGVHFPDFQIEQTAYETHGISKMKLVGKIGTKEGLQRMFRHLSSSKGGRKLCFVGHNIQNFDLRILYEEAKRHGLDKELKGVRFVDTLAVARDKDVWQNHEKERPKSFSLENLYSYLVGGVIPFQHSAVGDVLANAKVLESLDPGLTITRSKYVREFRFE